MAMPVTDWERRALIISLQASEAKLTAENKKITDHRDRLLKKMRRQATEIETMKSDWADATDSLAQQVTDKGKEIHQLKTTGRHIMKKASEWEAKNEDVKREYKTILEKAQKEIRDLKKEVSDTKHNEGLWMKESFSKENLKQRIGWLEMRWNDVTKERDDLKKENESLKENQKSFPCSATLVVASID